MFRSPSLYLYSLILDPEWRQKGKYCMCVYMYSFAPICLCLYRFYSLCSPDFMLTRLVLI